MDEDYRRFLAGDRSAFDRIVLAHREGLIWFIFRYVHELSAAEDISIDVFTELLLHPRRYNGKASLKTYLYMLGRSRALDHLKHQKVVRQIELPPVTEDFPDSCLPENTLLAREQRQAVRKALTRLPQEQQAVLYLIYFEDLTYAQAGTVLRKNAKQIDNLLYRAKANLRRLLAPEWEAME